MSELNITTLIEDPLNVTGDGLFHSTTGIMAPEGERIENFYSRAGQSVTDQVRKQQPARIGEVIETGGGQLNYQRIVHFPIQSAPGTPTSLKNIQIGFRSALVTMDSDSVQTAVLPCPVPADSKHGPDLRELAEQLIEDLKQYPPTSLKEIQMVDTDHEWIDRIKELI